MNDQARLRSTSRRAQFESAPPASRRVSLIVVMTSAGVLLAAVFFYILASPGRAGGAPAPVTVAAAAGADLRLPVADLADGIARFYTHTTAAGQEVRFFVMRSSDGVVRAAFDACDTCYRDRLGYRQQGDVMVCNKCLRTFRSVDINVLQGGCNPAPLERNVVGDQVVITAAALQLGASYF